MTAAQDLAMVVRLAALTEDRTRAEQQALERVALRVDREINAQVGPNPHLPSGVRRGLPFAPACSYPVGVHDKECPGCRGDGRAVEPSGGWSLLSVEVRS